MPLTIEQVKEYLATVGIVLPDFLVQMLFASLDKINECLEANYDENTANMIRMYLMTLLSLANGDKYITSQTGPSGASQSYKYGTLADRWNSTYSLLSKLDTKKCAAPILPTNPTSTAKGGIWVGKGGCMCEDK